jgi:Sel1 repeat
MYALGVLHSDLTQPPNIEAARHWFERAAEDGHIDAMYNLGYLYAKSIAPPNIEEARADGFSAPPTPGTPTPCTRSGSCCRVRCSHEAFKRGDEAAVRGACDRITGRIIEELPAALPTPDPDLTLALWALIDDGIELRWTESELADPPTPLQRETLQSRFGDLMSSLHAVSSIFEHDCALLDSTGRG